MCAEPPAGRRIEILRVEVAQKGNRISFDESALAPRSRIIIKRQVKEWHVPDLPTHPFLHWPLNLADLSGCAVAVVEPRRTRKAIPRDQRISHVKPEDRPAVVIAPGLRGTSMLPKTGPERASRSGLQGVRADPDDTGALAGVRTNFAGFQKK